MATKTKTRRTSSRPKMTAGEATRFDRLSVSSYAQLVTEIEQRRAAGIHVECKCEPYADTAVVRFGGRYFARDLPISKRSEARDMARNALLASLAGLQ